MAAMRSLARSVLFFKSLSVLIVRAFRAVNRCILCMCSRAMGVVRARDVLYCLLAFASGPLESFVRLTPRAGRPGEPRRAGPRARHPTRDTSASFAAILYL